MARVIYGHLKPSENFVRTGRKFLKRKFKGPLLADYYFNKSGDMDGMHKIGREAIQGWLSPEQERRQIKLLALRRRGKGPPKKGEGKRAKKKK